MTPQPSASDPTPRADQSRWFAEEVRPHEPALRAWLHRQYASLPDVDDVVQESYLRLLRAREAGPIVSVKAYLFSIARNVALGFFRKQRLFSEIPINGLEESRVLEDSQDIVATISNHQEMALAVEAIDRLPARCREIVVLRALHGLPHKEIAARLGLSEQTVRVQVARGMKKCTQFFRERGIAARGVHDAS